MSDVSRLLNPQAIVAAFKAFQALTPQAVTTIQSAKTTGISIPAILASLLPAADVTEFTTIESELEAAWSLFQSLGPVLQELQAVATQLLSLAKTLNQPSSNSAT